MGDSQPTSWLGERFLKIGSLKEKNRILRTEGLMSLRKIRKYHTKGEKLGGR